MAAEPLAELPGFRARYKDRSGHCFARPGHRYVKLRFVRLAKRFDRDAYDYLVHGLSLCCVACDGQTLVNVQAFSQRDFAFVEDQLAISEACYHVQLVVPELMAPALEILRDADLVPDRERDRLGLEDAELPCLVEKQLPLDQTRKFSVFEREKIALSIGDRIRFTKNVKHLGHKFLNNELRTVVGIDEGKIIFDKGEIIRNSASLHLDQGIAVTSHASQAKTVDQVIVSVRVRAFSQANEAKFYVSMSRARWAMHVFTDSKVALRDAVTRPSKRLSSWELLDLAEQDRTLKAELARQRAKPKKQQQEIDYER